MQKATTRDVARLAGVSQSTVSVVLSRKPGVSIPEETRERVQAAARELGYRSERAAKRAARQEVTVGLLAPTLSNPYYSFLLQNIQLYARSKGVRTIILNTLRDLDTDRKTLDGRFLSAVDGVLCLYAPKLALPEHVPAVIVGEKSTGQPCDTVSLNSHAAGYKMAEHLVSLGHERIVYVSSPFGNITDSRRIRLEGLRARLAESGLDKYLKVLVDTNETEQMDTAFEYNAGRAMAERLLRERFDVTAIVAVNDMTAAGCMSVLKENGVRIPSQMAVCGFDNLLISKILEPQLTSIDQMANHGSKTGLDLLLEKIGDMREDNRLSIRVEFEPHLFVRGSTVEGLDKDVLHV